MSIAPEQFRAGMRRLAASVTILATAHRNGTRMGMTATAVCSVTGDPPTLLCCINRENQTRDALIDAERFSVNLLHADAAPLANRFAQRLSHEERFSQGDWTMHDSGVPVLREATAWFACRLEQAVEVGSHTIFFGTIIDIHTLGDEGPPLLYAHGGYGRFQAA